MYRTIIPVLSLLFFLILSSCREKEIITVFHAGSLSIPLKEMAERYEEIHPDVTVQLEGAGSLACIRKITELDKPCDVLAVADYALIDELMIPEYTSYNILFAGNRLAIGYNNEDEWGELINLDNWHEILLKENVHFGRSNPDHDPSGYRTVITSGLAGRIYKTPDLQARLLEKDRKYIRPKGTELLPLLETGTIDFIFHYESVLVQHGLGILSLGDSLDLSNPMLNHWYSTECVTVKGATQHESIKKCGEAMVYGACLPKNGENPDGAEHFLRFLVEQGKEILERNGQPFLKPTLSEKSIITPQYLVAVDTNDATNDFYDNEKTYPLTLKSIIVDGETAEAVKVDLETLPMHSVIVKEAKWSEDSNAFIGAYRYDGPSLYDILNHIPLLKKNSTEFVPVIDAYVEITNDAGEMAVFSWGEIFYPVHRHEIIIATSVMHIVPSKTKDKWPLPGQAKIIAAADLITERNISNPTHIRIRSLDRFFKVDRDLDPLFAEDIVVYNKDQQVSRISELPGKTRATYPNIFYGRGRGIHGVTPFSGHFLHELLGEKFPVDRDAIMKGMFTVSAADGYRAAFSYSEIMNRNDQSEVLLIDRGEYYGGRFKIYPSADFFSDRSVKAVNGIWYEER